MKLLKRNSFLSALLFSLSVLALATILQYINGVSNEAIASPFNKTIVSDSQDNFTLITIIPALLLLTLLGFILSVSSLRYSFISAFKSKARRLVNESEEVEKLIAAFQKMAMTIEGRDKSLKEKKERAELANQSKSDFILNVSHELRTPMHAILNFAEIGKKKVNKGEIEKLSLYFSRIEESGERLLGMINGILDLTRLESGSVDFFFEKGNLAKCIKESLNSLMSLVEQKDIKVEIEDNTKKESIIFDNKHISQVVVNLLSNAIKFTPKNKKISITINNNTCKIEGSGKLSGTQVSVKNEGTPIPESELEAIFKRFIQSSNTSPGMGGSGIGLAICHEVIHSHNGKIWAENIEGGVNFNFFIPENCAKTGS